MDVKKKGWLGSVDTPSHTEVKRPGSASGILALQKSLLLYEAKKVSVTKETT